MFNVLDRILGWEPCFCILGICSSEFFFDKADMRFVQQDFYKWGILNQVWTFLFLRVKIKSRKKLCWQYVQTIVIELCFLREIID